MHFLEDKELDLTELVNQQMPKVPMAPSLRAHWMAIDGVQPSIPENPPPASKDQMLMESTNPLSKLNKKDAMDNKLGALLQVCSHGVLGPLNLFMPYKSESRYVLKFQYQSSTHRGNKRILKFKPSKWSNSKLTPL